MSIAKSLTDTQHMELEPLCSGSKSLFRQLSIIFDYLKIKLEKFRGFQIASYMYL